MNDIAEQIKVIVCERLELNPEEVGLDASFVADLGADSLDLVDLAMALEQAYSFRLKDSEYVHFTTISSAAQYIAERLGSDAQVH